MLQPLRTLLALLTFTLALSACGQKGPLYLPEAAPSTPESTSKQP